MKLIRFALLFIISSSIYSCQKSTIATVTGTPLAEFNEAPHNAFTDLIKYNGYYYCAFRIGSEHSSFDGKLRIMRSADSKSWNAFSLLSVTNMDIRDGHFFIDDKNVLSLSLNIRNVHDERQNIIYKLIQDSFIRSNVYKVDNDYMLWNFQRLNDSVYSIGYNVKQICFSSSNSQKLKMMLFRNTDEDCENFENKSVDKSITPENFGCPCEPSMVIMPDSSIITIARDEETPGKSHFGVSKYPYKYWKWTTFNYFVRGPKLALLPDGKLLLAAGSMENYDVTYYAIINPSDFFVEKIRAFPSGGDSGYPGVIIEGSTALISYYSSHEGNARIYMYRLNY